MNIEQMWAAYEKEPLGEFEEVFADDWFERGYKAGMKDSEHEQELECLREFCRQYQMEVAQLKAENEQLQTDKENAQYCFRKLKEINEELEGKLYQQAKATRERESAKYINSNKEVKWEDVFDCLQENEKLSIGSAMAIANRFNEVKL